MVSLMKKFTHPELSEISLEVIMQALSDPCRMKIIRTLMEAGDQELACNEFKLKQSKATCSHHFEVLRGAGLISSRAEGTKCLSSLRKKEINRQFPGLLKLVITASR